MAKAVVKTGSKTKIEDRSSLRGTLASVSFLGLFIVVTWVSIFILFVKRL